MTRSQIGSASQLMSRDILKRVGCLKIKLTADEVAAIDAPYQPRSIMGHK